MSSCQETVEQLREDEIMRRNWSTTKKTKQKKQKKKTTLMGWYRGFNEEILNPAIQ